MPLDEASLFAIGIGGSLAAPPLPHHRTYGSVYGGSLDKALAIFHANAGGFNDGAHRTGFGPFEQRRPGFTLPRRSKGQIPGYSAAWPVRGLHVQASCQRSGLRRSALRLLCPLLTSALRSVRLATTLVLNPRHSADL